MGKPEEVAAAALFLASDETASSTASNCSATAGWLRAEYEPVY